MFVKAYACQRSYFFFILKSFMLRKRELIASLYVCYCCRIAACVLCFVSLPRGVVGWSVVCDSFHT